MHGYGRVPGPGCRRDSCGGRGPVVFFLAAALLAFAARTSAQNGPAKWASWIALQAVPSPGVLIDHGAGGSAAAGELRWQAVPLNYSWSASALVPRAQFFLVNPMRRLSGSVEAFVEPAWTLVPLRESGDGRLALGTGARVFVPVAAYGEEVAVSLGAKAVFREGPGGEGRTAAAIELGGYFLLGIIGVRMDLSTDAAHPASFSLAIRYY